MSRQEWVNQLCRDNHIIDTRPLTPPKVQEWLREYNQYFGAMCTEESFRRHLRKGKRNLLIELGELEEEPTKDPDEEIVEANVRLQKQKQLYQDTNRIERKSFREYTRVENAVSAYAEELVNTLRMHGEKLSNQLPVFKRTSNASEVGMIQVTDTHFNELIDLPHNKYDMDIASHRLFKLYKESLLMFKARGIKEVVVAFSGDLMNSSRRMDELLNTASTKAKTTFVAVDLIKQFLWELSRYFKVSVVSVLGNESRVDKEMSFSNEAMSDNYDYTIMNMTRLLLEASGNKNISFGELDKMESIIEIKGHKILVTHDLPKATNTQKGSQSVIGMKYLQGNPIDCLIGGHLHATKNGLYGYRSSALCGSNSYSDHALHLAGRAGQNIYFLGEGYRHVMSVDLQEYTEGDCFDIQDSIVEYECKSATKTKKKTTIMSIVI